MTKKNTDEILVHYKGKYFSFREDDKSFTEAMGARRHQARAAIENGMSLGRLPVDHGAQCTLVDVGTFVSVAGRPGVQAGQLIAFNPGSLCAFDPESGRPHALGNSTISVMAGAFKEGMIVGCMVHAEDAGFGFNCTLINSSVLAHAQTSDNQKPEDVVLHLGGTYHHIDAERSLCVRATGKLLEGARHAIRAGVRIGTLSGDIGVGTMCYVVDLTALTPPDAQTDPIVLLRHSERGTVSVDLRSSHVHPASAKLHERAEAAFALGEWANRIPADHDLQGGMSCYILDLSALPRMRS